MGEESRGAGWLWGLPFLMVFLLSWALDIWYCGFVDGFEPFE